MDAIIEEMGERLYILSHNVYIQYNGSGAMPPELKQYLKEHGGEHPPYMPLPQGPVVFQMDWGDLVKWSGKGALPGVVIQYVCENGMLPPYEH